MLTLYASNCALETGRDTVYARLAMVVLLLIGVVMVVMFMLSRTVTTG
jgi:hypothetical protein